MSFLKEKLLVLLFVVTFMISNRLNIVEGNSLFGFKLPKIDDFLGLNEKGNENYNDDRISLLDQFLLDIVPKFIGQKSGNYNGTKSMFMKYALEDESNDDAYRMNAHQLIERSGFKYESYDCISDDGYITTITRLINPLADRSQLRRPPVLMMHGGTIDVSAYLIASSIQHHPEVWPRTEKDGEFKSWNRSLAYVLANNGFDVWLAETRGSNENNMKHVNFKGYEDIFNGENLSNKNMTYGENIAKFIKQLTGDYWSFTQDDIIAHEVKAQIDLVLKLTKSKKLSLFTYSLSTPLSLAFLSIRPDYGEKIQGFISMAPIISGINTNDFVKVFFQIVCPLTPDPIGKIFFTNMITTQQFRELSVLLSRPKKFRYSFLKMFINFIMGPSAQYETLLEINLIGHLLRHVSFKELKQMCQQMRSNKLQKYDYGSFRNKFIYNQTDPPIYDLSNLNLNTWIIVAAENDALSTLETKNHLIDLVKPKPIAEIIAPGFGHLDLIAGIENDRYVNLPILKYLESVSSIGGYNDKNGNKDFMIGSETSTARLLDLKSLIPQDITQSTRQISKTIGNITSSTMGTTINPVEIIENLQKSWIRMIGNIDFNVFGNLTNFGDIGKYLPKFPQFSINASPSSTSTSSSSGVKESNNYDNKLFFY